MCQKKSLTLRLFTDACSGQNKDTNMMMFLLNYIHKSRTFKYVEYYFPIRGHSYMPPDGIFGRFEQELRKNDTILEPNEYHKVFATDATVNVLGTDWVISIFMDASKKALVKKNFPLKCVSNVFSSIQKSIKPILVLKIHIMVCQQLSSVQKVPALPEENHVSQKKRQDVDKLLKFVTLSEHPRMFYQNALSDNVEGYQDNNIVVYDEEEPFV
ncbi:hypothetical protein PR048_023052 [Dryococelus australis]|uniref:DUF7869 domain-containing protein n=1 Tax=Dryococelus australis TaxID=614101 RepID=A0ABQ9GT33_9NEOP|nr:hypothetical protein PR048_023052 [Dryococelus australis]